jgi:putative transposase
VARLPRLSIAGQLHHVLWRGNGQLAVFVDDEDRQMFKRLLIQHANAHALALHAWALMPDHVHLLLTPQHANGLSLALQAVGRVYVPYYNRRHGHRGTVWEGRFRSTVLEAAHWMLPAMIWLDTHPYRSGLSAIPDAHPYTSAAHYLGLVSERALTTPPQYWAIGNTPFAREAAYRTILERGLDDTAVHALTQATLKGWALGSPAFVAELQKNTARRLSQTEAGRPSLATSTAINFKQK